MFTGDAIVEELQVTGRSTPDMLLQFRWVQNDTSDSPAWAIDDIIIYCLSRSSSCFKSISFEESSE